MKSSIITNETSSRHFVQNYRFKVLSTEHADLSHASAAKTGSPKDVSDQMQNEVISSEHINQDITNATSSISATPANINQNDSFVEELLKKSMKWAIMSLSFKCK